MTTTTPAASSASQGTTLNRTLRTPSLVLFGLAYLTPIIVLSIFGIISQASQGAASASYLVALVAMLFTAHSYGRMAKAYPVAGSAYTYVQKSIDPRAGFMVGWAVLLDYLFLPMVIWLIGGAYLSAQFPAVPSWIWIVGFVVITSVLNILGIQVAEKATTLLMAFQTLVVLLFLVFCVIYLLSDDNSAGFTLAPLFNEGSGLGPIISGAAIAAYSFLGFDAVTTLTEETIEPEKRMPKAIMLIALIGGAVFVVASFLTQLVHPGYNFDNVDSAAMTIAIKIGGAWFSAVFLAGLIIGQFASGLAAQASASRLLYAMGRDNVLPRRIFGYLSPRFHTPAFNIVISGLVGLIAIVMDVTTSTSFVNYGGFLAFSAVNIAVVFYYRSQRRAGEKLNVFSYVVIPVIGGLICLTLFSQLDIHAQILGWIWLAIGFVILIGITHGFRRQPPQFDDAAAH